MPESPLEVFTGLPEPEDPGPGPGPVRVRVYILLGQSGTDRVPFYCRRVSGLFNIMRITERIRKDPSVIVKSHTLSVCCCCVPACVDVTRLLFSGLETCLSGQLPMEVSTGNSLAVIG